MLTNETPVLQKNFFFHLNAIKSATTLKQYKTVFKDFQEILKSPFPDSPLEEHKLFTSHSLYEAYAEKLTNLVNEDQEKTAKYAKKYFLLLFDIADSRRCQQIRRRAAQFNEKTLQINESFSKEIDEAYIKRLASLLSNDKPGIGRNLDLDRLLLETKTSLKKIFAITGIQFAEMVFWTTATDSVSHYVRQEEFIPTQASYIGKIRPGPERDALIDKCLEENRLTLEELNTVSKRRYYKVTFDIIGTNTTRTHYLDLEKINFAESPFYGVLDMAQQNQCPIQMDDIGVDGLLLANAIYEGFLPVTCPSAEQFFHDLQALSYAGDYKSIKQYRKFLEENLSLHEEEPSEWMQAILPETVDKVLKDFNDKISQPDHVFHTLSPQTRVELEKFYRQFAWMTPEYINILKKIPIPLEVPEYHFTYQKTFNALEELYFTPEQIAQEPILSPLAFLLELWKPKKVNIKIDSSSRRGFYLFFISHAQSLKELTWTNTCTLPRTPLHSVEGLKLSPRKDNTNSKGNEFAKIFPNVKNVEVNLSGSFCMKSLLASESLQHLTVKFRPSLFPRFCRKFPQIIDFEDFESMKEKLKIITFSTPYVVHPEALPLKRLLVLSNKKPEVQFNISKISARSVPNIKKILEGLKAEVEVEQIPLEPISTNYVIKLSGNRATLLPKKHPQ